MTSLLTEVLLQCKELYSTGTTYGACFAVRSRFSHRFVLDDRYVLKIE